MRTDDRFAIFTHYNLRMKRETEPIIYEAGGGSDGLLRLAHAWHVRVLEDEVVSHALSHGQTIRRTPSAWLRPGRGAWRVVDDSDRHGSETFVVRMHSGNRVQLTAFFTITAILTSTSAVNSFNAKTMGHMAPSSSFASWLKPSVK